MNFKRKKPRRKVRCAVCSYNRTHGNKESARSIRDRRGKKDAEDQIREC